MIPKDDSLRFEYVFGSEEYNNATCGPYNDAFSFFISGPGITGQDNMALVPGTRIPVAVNSINNGVPGPQGNISNCTSMGPGAPFTAYYVDNSAGTSISYKGFTTVLRATHAVQPCATYHLQLTIADAGNGLYDSGVFLKAGSLRTATYNISAISSTGAAPPVVAPGCASARVTIRRSEKKPLSQSIHYQIGGNALNGGDYAAIADSLVIAAGDSAASFPVNALQGPINGPKTVKLYLLDPYACGQQRSIIDSTTVTLYDAPAVTILTPDTTICRGDVIALRTRGTAGLAYSWTPAANVIGPATPNPLVRPDSATSYIVTASLPNSGCAAVHDTVAVSLMKGPLVNAGPDREVCNGQSLLVSATAMPAGGYTYSWIGPDGSIVAAGDILSIAPARTSDSGRYIAQALGATSVCFGRDTVLIKVKPLPAAPRVLSPVELCVHADVHPLRASGYGQLWYTDTASGGSPEAPVPSVEAGGQQHYYVSAKVDGCESRKAAIDVLVFNCCGSEVVLPSAITPNGDGRNDRFGVLSGAEGVGVDTYVYNRWGQAVFHGYGAERWDGTQAGQPVPAGIYFYQVSLDCRNGNRVIKKGELTVIR